MKIYSELGEIEMNSELSEREIVIIRLIAQGLTGKEIGVFLGISDSTVKNHVARIYKKLSVDNRAQLMVYAARHGLLESAGVR